MAATDGRAAARLALFDALAEAGVKRISLATSLYRAAMSGLLSAAREVQDKGTFGYLDHAPTAPELNAFMQN